MNPSNPTTSDLRDIEQLFYRQMRRNTRLSTSPVAQARQRLEAKKSDEQRHHELIFLRSFDFQFSDQWA